MGNVLTTLFMPVGLGGMGVDFRKDKAPKPTPAPTYDENKEKDKAAESAAESTKKRRLEQANSTRTSALGALGNVTTGKKTLLGA